MVPQLTPFAVDETSAILPDLRCARRVHRHRGGRLRGAREDDIVFDVIQRMWRRNAVMALVVRGRRVPRPTDVVGVITKEHVADSVANSVKIYPR